MAQAIVIGAGPAGLAAAACLTQRGIAVRMFERADRIAPAWHGHYDRLTLHTARARSGLPGRHLPNGPVFPTRDEMIAYFDDYAAAFGLTPAFGAAVETVRRAGGRWRVDHTGGADAAEIVVFATGLNGTPRLPDWPGMDRFAGPILHGADYRTAAPFHGAAVLVVGFGNTAADIALDLAEAGVTTGLSVRGPVNILPKTVLGIPTTSMGALRRLFGPAAADRAVGPILRLHCGRPEDYGLTSAAKGPMRQVVEDGRIPMIDPGILRAIRDRQVTVYPGIDRLEEGRVIFRDGRTGRFDTIIAATGYDLDLRPMLPENGDLLDAAGRPRVSGGPSGAEGLYFCSYHVSPNGQLRQAGIEARALSAHAARTVAVAG